MENFETIQNLVADLENIEINEEENILENSTSMWTG